MSGAGMSDDDAEEGEPTQAYVDTTKASVARVYDAFLGGKDNYEVDRVVFREILEVAPEASATAKELRAWLIRVVRFLAGPAEIDQFVDCGSGLPTVENTHEVAQRVNPEAVVVYVDNDPIVIAHGRALLAENDRTHFADANLAKPDELLRHPVVTRHLDFDRPIALIQCNTIHHLMDDERPYEIMKSYIDALPSGSYVALCHFYDSADGSDRSLLAREMEARYNNSTMGSGRFRTREEIASYFEGLEMIEPGLVKVHEWWPDGPRIEPLAPIDHLFLGGVGRKP
jgi:SAM-dependent methyltransferase